jgi:hypothetical protein
MLPEPLHSVIVGSLLGDACLERNGRHGQLCFVNGWREHAPVHGGSFGCCIPHCCFDVVLNGI